MAIPVFDSAFNRGFNHAKSGGHKKDNPFPQSGEDFKLWNDGFDFFFK
jgi:hypothetical protein